MFWRRAGTRPTTALALAGIALAALTLSFLAQADPASAAATLVIRTPGTYDGRGATIDVGCGADNNVLIQASNVTLRNYTLLHAEEAAIRIDSIDADYSNIVIENVTIKDFNCAGGEDQFRAGVACWGCTALTVTELATSRQSTLTATASGSRTTARARAAATPSPATRSSAAGTASAGSRRTSPMAASTRTR